MLVVLMIAYFPTLYILLELPKIIINRVIGGTDTHEFLNYSFDPKTVLVILALAYLALYLINALIKLAINIRKGIIGERLIRRLRYSLLDHLLRFPVQRFRVVSQGELISQINAEADTLSAYFSEAVTLPLFQGGTMLTVLFFMFVQSVWLGLAAVALIPLQLFVIPKMQRKVNVLNHKRVRQVRRFSEYIGETVNGAQAIRVHGVQRYMLAGCSKQLSRLSNVRVQLYKQKFHIKFVNNTINQLTPFLFYLIGGILVLDGQLSIGALVAAIAGHKDMVAPWKALVKYYQMSQDAKIKYEQLAQQFDIPYSDQTDYYAEVSAREDISLFPLRLKNVVTEESGKRILSGFNLEIVSGEHVAIIEPDAVKRQHIAEVILSLRKPAYGSAWLGKSQLKDIPGSLKSRRLAFQPASPPIFNTSVYENILLSLKHLPMRSVSGKEKNESFLSGNSNDEFSVDWQDYDDYRFENTDEFYDWYLQVMEATDADRSVIRNGLFQLLSDDYSTEQAEKIVSARPLIGQAMQESEVSVASFNENEWCYGLSIAENLAFGKLTDDKSTPGEVLYTTKVAQILSANGFDRIVEQIGRHIAVMIVQGLSSELSRESTMQVFRLTSENHAEGIARTARTIARKSPDQCTEQDLHFLLLLFLNLVLDDHPDIRLPGSVISRIMFIRDEIDSVLDTEQRTRLQRFEYGQFHPGLTVLENLMFGLIPSGTSPESINTVVDVIDQVINEAGLTNDILFLTLKSAEAGISGSRLSPTSRQSLPLARVLIKKPEIIVFNDGLSAYEEVDQVRIKANIGSLLPNTSIIWLANRLDNSGSFDRVINTSVANIPA